MRDENHSKTFEFFSIPLTVQFNIKFDEKKWWDYSVECMEDITNGNNQKPVTLDDLATMVKRGFDDVSERFDILEGKVDTLEGKVATQAHVDSRFDGLEKIINEDAVGASVQRDRKLNEKTNVVAHKLGDKSVFTHDDVRDVERISPIAVSPTI